MKFLKINIFKFLTFLFFILLISGHLINKKNSISKKNEISNFAKQLKIRNSQLSKIQKRLFEKNLDINNLINNDKIEFKKNSVDEFLVDFNGYNFSKKEIKKELFDFYSFTKYSTIDILSSGNIGAIGTAFVDFHNNDEDIILATYDGIFATAKINSLTNFKKIRSNIKNLIQYDNFYFHEHYGIKDILVNRGKLYVSYIGLKKKDCYDLKIINANLNEIFLDFKLLFQTNECVSEDNDHGFWGHQGAGGRMIELDDSHILFTTGDFRNRPLAQEIGSEFGKILRINLNNNKTEVISIGHRNPQGIYYSKNFDFIISTEHGPKGGDEININLKPFTKVKNFGWPISSYGEHYSKHYSKKVLKEAPLYKSHKKYGFEEPVKYFDPSIGISQLISLNHLDSEFFIGAMGNEIKDQDLGLHYIKLDESKKKIIEHYFIPLNERVRDIVISKNKHLIILFLETSASIMILKRKI
jgi:hypothetical protein